MSFTIIVDYNTQHIKLWLLTTSYPHFNTTSCHVLTLRFGISDSAWRVWQWPRLWPFRDDASWEKKVIYPRSGTHGVPGLAASGIPEDLLERQTLKPHLQPTESETLVIRTYKSVLQQILQLFLVHIKFENNFVGEGTDHIIPVNIVFSKVIWKVLTRKGEKWMMASWQNMLRISRLATQ